MCLKVGKISDISIIYIYIYIYILNFQPMKWEKMEKEKKMLELAILGHTDRN